MEHMDGIMTSALVMTGMVLAALSGVPGMFLSRESHGGERWAAGILITAALCGIFGAVLSVVYSSTGIDVPWAVPGGRFTFKVDGLSAIFVVQVFLLSAVGSVYGLGYWKQSTHLRDGRKLRLFYGVLTAGMVLVFCAQNTMLFIAGWEIMAMAAFLSLTARDDDSVVRDVGHLYMVATRLATLCLFALFALLYLATGNFNFGTPIPSMSPRTASAIFFLALVGFGLKAGVMPMHVWLPGAHANAPSHVSALLSGVLLKTGIYGFIRLFSLFPHPPLWWGQVMLGLGVVSGVLGVAFAIGQHDYKRLLAYHSVENIGIICMGLGVALLGNSLGQGALVALGLGGALLHVWNHGLFKSLLFLSAGSVLHATGTREIDHLGGLFKRMPWTAGAFLLGAVAICGLPPLNGFISELFIYLGLFKSVTIPHGTLWLAGTLGVPALALIGALASACFIKVFGVMFLGEARTGRVLAAHEATRVMLGPMGLLAGLCLFIGLVPWAISPLLDGAVRAFTPLTSDPIAMLAPLGWISFLGVLLLGAGAGGGVLLLTHLRKSHSEIVPTWGCGYAAPKPSMQYSSSSFAQTIVGLFSWALHPKVHNPRMHEIFPRQQSFESEVDDVVLEEFLIPTAEKSRRLLRWFKWVQRGNQNAYLLYIFLTLLVLLLWR
jgi:hydrogenase-4 component B